MARKPPAITICVRTMEVSPNPGPEVHVHRGLHVPTSRPLPLVQGVTKVHSEKFQTPQAAGAGPVAKCKVGTTQWKTGRWSLDEKILFLYGLRKFGKGRWKKISQYVPNRSLVQIKSHAQKVLKRYNQGENVFYRLDDNASRLQKLLATIPITGNGQESSKILLPKFTSLTQARNKDPPPSKELDARQHIIAASALCQLAAPSDASRANNWEKTETDTASATTSGSSTPTFNFSGFPGRTDC